VEAGSNTSIVTLRVVGGDEKGSLKPETVKYGPSPLGLGFQKDYAGEDQQHKQRDRHVLSSDRAPHENKTVTVKE
jgi:hypothetical protein